MTMAASSTASRNASSVLEESSLRYYEALSNYLKTVLGGTTGSAYAQPQGRIKIVED